MPFKDVYYLVTCFCGLKIVNDEICPKCGYKGRLSREANRKNVAKIARNNRRR